MVNREVRVLVGMILTVFGFAWSSMSPGEKTSWTPNKRKKPYIFIVNYCYRSYNLICSRKADRVHRTKRLLAIAYILVVTKLRICELRCSVEYRCRERYQSVRYFEDARELMVFKLFQVHTPIDIFAISATRCDYIGQCGYTEEGCILSDESPLNSIALICLRNQQVAGCPLDFGMLKITGGDTERSVTMNFELRSVLRINGVQTRYCWYCCRLLLLHERNGGHSSILQNICLITCCIYQCISTFSKILQNYSLHPLNSFAISLNPIFLFNFIRKK